MRIELQSTNCRRGISLTPLIDIVFILLIFFILESNFLQLRELGLNLPESKTTQHGPSRGLSFELSAAGNIWINGLSMNQQEFAQYLQAKAFPPETNVLLVTDPDVAVQTVVTFIDTLSQFSLSQVQLRSRGLQNL